MESTSKEDRVGKAALRAVINLVYPKSQIHCGKPLAHRRYRDLTVTIHGDARLPVGAAMELATYLVSRQFEGEAYFCALPPAREQFSGVRIITGLPDTYAVEFSLWKQGTGVSLFLYCDPSQYEAVCERLGIEPGVPDDNLSILDKQYPNIKRVQVEGVKPWEMRNWPPEVLQTVLENIRRDTAFGAMDYGWMKVILAVTFGIHPDLMDAQQWRSLYKTAIEPLIKAGYIEKTKTGKFRFAKMPAGKPIPPTEPTPPAQPEPPQPDASAPEEPAEGRKRRRRRTSSFKADTETFESLAAESHQIREQRALLVGEQLAAQERSVAIRQQITDLQEEARLIEARQIDRLERIADYDKQIEAIRAKVADLV